MTLQRGAIAGEHRGRRITMSYAGIPYGDTELLATSVRVVVRSPLGSSLTITPKWSLQSGFPDRWVYRILGPKTLEIDDHFSIHSNPPDLAAQLFAHPRISAILWSDPKPTIQLKQSELRFKRPGGLPNPQDALALFDTVCDLAELIEQASGSSGAG
jgi:hypothetical protein